MQFAKLIVAAATFAVAHAVEFTNPTFAGITAGTPFNLTWSGASGPVTLTLKNGASSNLQTVSTIASGLTGNSFVWTPSASLPADTYAIQIDDSTNVPNYSTQFQLIGGSTSSISSSLASLSSSVSSALSSITANVTSTSATATKTGNSTVTSTSSKSGSSASKTSSSASGTSSETSAPSGSSASSLASPLAMIFLALAAFITLN